MKKIVLIILGILILAGLAGSVWWFVQKGEEGSPAGDGTACPDPFVFEMPIDLDRATSVLYPGQYRSGEYKPHGGFRFDNSRPNEITVTAPYDASVVAGARYPADGEIQYTFDFKHPCGIQYRFGHLLTLAPKFQALAEKFPLPEGLDSRTTSVNPPVEVKQGEVIATAVGFNSYLGNVNTFVDWGVYDYRQKNTASQDPAWLAEHSQYEIEQYAVCWFDWISPDDEAKVRALSSSDPQSGTTSDYCQ